MNDLINLLAQFTIEFANHRLDRSNDIVADELRASERLLRQRSDRRLDSRLSRFSLRLELSSEEGLEFAQLLGCGGSGRLRLQVCVSHKSSSVNYCGASGLGAEARVFRRFGSASSLPINSSAPDLPSINVRRLES